MGWLFGVMISRTDDLSPCSVNYSTSRMQYPSLAPLSQISEVFVCPLGRLDQSQISPTKGRFDPLHISSKVPLSIMMIGVDGRALKGA